MSRTLVAWLLLAPFALLAVDARAEEETDVEVWIVRHVSDLALAKAVKETAAYAELEVEVERALQRARVTVLLDDPVVGALQKLAHAAGAHLWKLGDGRYAVRTKPPPPSAVPPSVELVGEEPGEVEPPAPEAEWAQAIRKALDATPYEGVFRRTPLPDVLAAMAKQADVPFHLDPAVVRGKSRKELLVDFEDPLGGLSVEEALLLFCATRDLGHTVRWGCLYVSTRERLSALPETAFAGGSGEPSEALAKALGTHVVTCRLKRASLGRAMEILTQESGTRIVIDPLAAKQSGRTRFTEAFHECRLGDALALLLVPVGLALRADGDVLHVTVRTP